MFLFRIFLNVAESRAVRIWNMTPEGILNWISFLTGRRHVYFCISTNETMLTFNLVSCCRHRDEQICHYDDKQTTSRLCLNSSLMSTRKRVKVHLRFTGKKPPAHTTNCRCDAWKCDIMPQIKVNPSKATCFFHSYSPWTVSRLLARRHASPAAIGCLSSMYPSNRSSSSSLAHCLWG